MVSGQRLSSATLESGRLRLAPVAADEGIRTVAKGEAGLPYNSAVLLIIDGARAWYPVRQS